jgi:hypothetical protein
MTKSNKKTIYSVDKILKHSNYLDLYLNNMNDSMIIPQNITYTNIEVKNKIQNITILENVLYFKLDCSFGYYGTRILPLYLLYLRRTDCNSEKYINSPFLIYIATLFCYDITNIHLKYLTYLFADIGLNYKHSPFPVNLLYLKWMVITNYVVYPQYLIYLLSKLDNVKTPLYVALHL